MHLLGQMFRRTAALPEPAGGTAERFLAVRDGGGTAERGNARAVRISGIPAVPRPEPARAGTSPFPSGKESLTWKKRFELIITASGQVVYEYDLDTGAILWSGSLESVLGYSKEEMGGVAEWEERIHPEDREEAVRLLEVSERTGTIYDVEYRFRHKDGRYLWMHGRGLFLNDEERKVRRMVGMMEDINRRKQVEILHNAAYRIADASDSSLGLTDLYRTVHEIVGTVMPAGNFYIALYDRENELIRFPYFVDEADPPPAPLRPNKGLTEYVIRTGKPLLCDEATDRELRRAGLVELIGAPSAIWLGVPLRFDNGAFGAMVVQHYSDSRAYGPAELRMLEFVSSQVAKSIVHKRSEEALREGMDKLKRTVRASIDALASAVELRDPYTTGHQDRVTRLAVAVAEEMKLDPERIEGLRIAGIIHDIGKLYVPAEILSKPTKLSDLEYAMIRMHSQVGFTILSKIDFPWPIADIVHQHHEAVNGSGYPLGLKGKDILFEARILCVADVVEAMSSHRPYRAALGLQAAFDEITQKRGILYDREVVDACLALFRRKGFKFE